jgi:hypothetical protein
MAQKRRVSTAGPTLEEIWFVLTAAPLAEVRGDEPEGSVSDAYVDFHLKRHTFIRRLTPATWADAVTAARRLHREIKAAGATNRRGSIRRPRANAKGTRSGGGSHDSGRAEGLGEEGR